MPTGSSWLRHIGCGCRLGWHGCPCKIWRFYVEPFLRCISRSFVINQRRRRRRNTVDEGHDRRQQEAHQTPRISNLHIRQIFSQISVSLLVILRQTVTELCASMPATPVSRTVVQYPTAFCSRKEAASDRQVCEAGFPRCVWKKFVILITLPSLKSF